jgi:predicted RNA-binding protein with PIN domain
MNVIGSRPDGWWRDRHAAQRELVARLAALAASTGDEVTVVFDSPPPPGGSEGPEGLTVVYTPGSSADDEIVRRLDVTDPSRRPTVVTSDGELASRVRARGAEVAPAAGFRNRLDTLPER